MPLTGSCSLDAQINRGTRFRRDPAKPQQKGEPAGVAAFFNDSADDKRRILLSEDDQACNALLALARVNRSPLPLDTVGLLQRKEATREATDAYLMALDTVEARQMLEVANVSSVLGVATFKPLPRAGKMDYSKTLASRMPKKNFTRCSRQGITNATVISSFAPVRTNHFTWTDGNGLFRRRTLSASEWSEFETFIKNQGVDGWPGGS